MSPERRLRTAPLRLAVVAVGAVLVAGAASMLLEDRGPSTERAPSLESLVHSLLEEAVPGDGAYRAPTPAELTTAREAFAAAAAGQADDARAVAARIGYEAVHADARGEKVLVLRERGPRRRGWGLFAFAGDEGLPLVVEVTHPLSDLHTAEFGLELFGAGRGSALLIAGAHRDAGDGDADVAHRPDSLLEVAHRTVLERRRVVVQPHGFHAAEDRAFEAVVSSGREEPGAVAASVAQRLEAAGVDVCRYGADRCDDLGGTTNVQGASAARAGAAFIHLELALELRQNPRQRELAVQAVVAGLAR